MPQNKSLSIMVPLLIILSLMILYKYGYGWLRSDLAEMRETLSVKEKTLDQYRSLIAEKSQIEQWLGALREERNASLPRLITGETPSVSAAVLLDGIREILVAHGGTISSERVGQPERLDPLHIISVQFDAVLPDASALKDALYALETEGRYLVVNTLDVRVENMRRPGSLVVKMKVSALSAG
jgi:hypothetical protein